MAKAPSTAIGVDLGFHTLKAVLLHRKGSGKVALSGFATRVIEQRSLEPDTLSHHLKLLLHDLGGSARATGVAFWGGTESILRIIEQPPMAVEMLRQALKFNGKTLLHQDCADFVFDCDLLSGQMAGAPTGMGISGMANERYLVGGVPRAGIEQITQAFGRLRISPGILQLSPIALLNCFEFARPEVALSEPFLLLDIGHRWSTVLIGSKGGLKLVRSVEYGGAQLLRDLTMNGAMDVESAHMLIEQGDTGMAQASSESLSTVARELTSSIGFFEGQWDQTVSKVYVSGGAVRADMTLQVLSEDLNLPCEAWSPFDRCEMALNRHRQSALEKEGWNLNVAFGIAAEILGVV